ncbi:MAG: DUF86 domain-containing protein [Candidatus Ancaeobacter aquaticus]|nr:DUF86 domain-containing protein [Candidatus Ancaeobacter aquaticus]
MVDKTVIETLIKELKTTLDYLKSKLSISEDEYLTNIDIQAAVERKLEVAIQLSIDIGSQIISQQNFPYPNTYREIFSILSSQKVIPNELAGNLEKMAGFRNILVHDYVMIDSKEVYRILHNSLTDIEQYLKSIVEYIT